MSPQSRVMRYVVPRYRSFPFRAKASRNGTGMSFRILRGLTYRNRCAQQGALMAHFKAMERPEPGVPGGGNRRWYASVVLGNEMSIEELTRNIEKMCTVNGADIRAVLYALVDISIAALERGEIVRLGDLGSIRLSINSDSCDTEDEVSRNLITKSRIVFTPGRRLKAMLAAIKYTKVNPHKAM